MFASIFRVKLLKTMLLSVWLLAGCAHSMAPASSAATGPVTINAWSVPTNLKVGRLGYLQVKLSPARNIDSATLSVESASTGIAFAPREIALKDLHPVPPEKAAPDGQLDAATIYTFKITASKPGVYPVEVKLACCNAVTAEKITVKAD